MKEIEEKFCRIKNKLPYAAIVKITVEESESNAVIISCDGVGWSGSQGYLDSVSKNGYEEWKEGATIGAKYALGKTE